MTAPQASRWEDLDRPPLRVQALRRVLVAPTGPLGRLDVVEQIGSTNAALALAGAQGEQEWPDWSVLVAEHQQAGRGRLGRGWDTPARSALTFSVLLRPREVPLAGWSWLPLLAGVAVVRALRTTAGVPAGLKWPNDVLVPADRATSTGQGSGVHGARKVAGILAEVVPGQEAAAVLGIGLNVTSSLAELPVGSATSLRLCGSASTDRDTLLRAVLRELVEQVGAWRDASGDAVGCGLAAAARELCLTLGLQVRVEMPGRPALLGTAEGIDDDGRLLVRTGDAELVPVAAGDVLHVRDAAAGQAQ